MNYEEKISMLDEDDFVSLFSKFGAEPRWVTSAGKRAIQVLGLCHDGENHSALFDPETLKVHCFSECNGAMLFHTWVRRTLKLETAHSAKELIMDWMDGQNIDFSSRTSRRMDFEYRERPYDPNIAVDIVPGMDPEAIEELYERFESAVLPLLTWASEDGIEPETLDFFDVRWDPVTESVVLPHHNIKGEIVGIYERSFKPLRRDVKKEHPEMDWKLLVQYPRAKYVPLLRHGRWLEEEKTSWSFPNSCNLYGLHLAEPFIAEKKKAIIFEGGKSVMLAHQYGYQNSVATHTFGAHLNHISMLIQAGAVEEIILAFDKQYQKEEGQAWELYEHKTRSLAKKIAPHVKKVYRIRDEYNYLDYKDSPTDKGADIFELLFYNRERLNTDEDNINQTLLAAKRARDDIPTLSNTNYAAQVYQGLMSGRGLLI